MNVAEYLEHRMGRARIKIDPEDADNYIGMFEPGRGPENSEGIDLIWQEHAGRGDGSYETRGILAEMPLASNCGMDCQRVIDACATFLEYCVDVNDAGRGRLAVHNNVFRAIGHAINQCVILIRG